MDYWEAESLFTRLYMYLFTEYHELTGPSTGQIFKSYGYHGYTFSCHAMPISVCMIITATIPVCIIVFL